MLYVEDQQASNCVRRDVLLHVPFFSTPAIAGQRFAGLGVAMKITIGTSVSETLKKYPSLNNPAAIRAMEQGNREVNTSITGQVTTER